MSDKVKVYHTQDLQERTPIPGAVMNFVHGDSLTLVEWNFEPDTPLPEHSHPNEQITRVVSGVLELFVDGEKFTLTAGNTAVIPPDVVHSARSVTACHVMDAFTPVRDDM